MEPEFSDMWLLHPEQRTLQTKSRRKHLQPEQESTPAISPGVSHTSDLVADARDDQRSHGASKEQSILASVLQETQALLAISALHIPFTLQSTPTLTLLDVRPICYTGDGKTDPIHSMHKDDPKHLQQLHLEQGKHAALVSIICMSVRLRGAGDRGRDDDDHRDRHKPKWNEEQGASWERFKRELRVYTTGIYASPNDDYNIWQVLQGTDMHGDALGAPAMIVGQGAGAQARYRTKRQAKAWSILCDLLDEGSDIRKLLMNLNDGDQAAPAGGQRGIGRRGFLLMDTHGAQRFDDEYVIGIISICTEQREPGKFLKDKCHVTMICVRSHNEGVCQE